MISGRRRCRLSARRVVRTLSSETNSPVRHTLTPRRMPLPAEGRGAAIKVFAEVDSKLVHRSRQEFTTKEPSENY
jgi:hypothetical protein